jgi:hypothetical protein
MQNRQLIRRKKRSGGIVLKMIGWPPYQNANMSAVSVMAAKCLIADGYDALHRASLCVGVQG